MPDSFHILGPDGPFAKSYPWFNVRVCQQEMAESVESAIHDEDNLIAESGTGTGKTFGYLVPPLLAKKKTVISTRTKNLQEQLFQTDIPWVCNALDINPDVRVLKGRSNYFCLYRHELVNRQSDLLGATQKINHVYDWVSERGDGDISEYPHLPSEYRQMITTTADNCIGSQCDFSKECYVNRARNQARNAEVLVVNHNLLCLNFLRQGNDESGLLSNADVVVVDEAHRFPEIAAQVIGITMSTDRINQLCANLEIAGQESPVDEIWIGQIAQQILELAGEARKALPDASGRYALRYVEENSEFMQIYHGICNEIEVLVESIDPFSDASPTLEKCRDHAAMILDDARSIFERQDEKNASWYEKTKEGFSVSRMPLDPGKDFGERVKLFQGSWIFTSATLAIGEDFTHFKNRLGIEGAVSAQWESPFRFAEQALIYFPSDMPQPNSEWYDERVTEVIKEIMPITKGRTFVLFTSHKSMRSVYERLQDQLDYRLLCQGLGSSSGLLEKFKDDGNAVLLGTSSFWEGVDVKGDALSCVIIAKLPFTPPNDPVMEAREQYMATEGKNIFNDWQVPAAVLTMKQGAGRLIRDVKDKGMLVICDSRVRSKPYGIKFLDSLPPMRRTDKIEDVKRFFSR